ncbi:dihydrolipoamide acetyltransferase family protein [Arthrobacter alpinus]|nr:dihydrolipoamide acetyltransferase family protein [Arthrobacter alpinus]
MSVQTTEQVFLLPDLGEGLVEVELLTWLVAVGERVEVDQPIAEVETAKSVVEVPSPFEGTVTTLHGAQGDVMEVGKPLITIAAPGSEGEFEVEAEHGAPATSAPEHLSESTSAETQQAKPEGSGNVLIGYGTSETLGTGRRRPSLATAAHTAPLVISPVVRKLANDHGIALADIHGSGEDGLILRTDVVAAIGSPPPRDVPEAREAPEPREAPEVREVREVREGAAEVSGVVHQRTGLSVTARVPLSGMKKAAAASLLRSRREIPEATVWVDVDATALLEMRAGLGERAPGVLAFVSRFVAAGLANFPELNMSLENHDGTDELVAFDGINLGFAVQTQRGLMVPVLRNAQGRTARELHGAIAELAAAARAGRASPAELSGGTFTINNYGVLGVDGSAVIINYPEAAMLGLGRIIDKPWVVDGELRVRKMTELTLAFDHRVCDGAVAAGFLRFVADAMENPAGVLADL